MTEIHSPSQFHPHNNPVKAIVATARASELRDAIDVVLIQ